MRSQLSFPLFAVILLVISLAYELAAQTTVTGEIAGTVLDSSGAIVSDAAVSLKNETSGELGKAHTDSFGQFRFALLKPGTYDLTVLETSGQHVTVNLGRVTSFTVRLAIGSLTTTVEVKEQQPLLDTRAPILRRVTRRVSFRRCRQLKAMTL